MLTPQRWRVIQAMQSGVKLGLDPDGRVILGSKQEKRALLNALLQEGYIEPDESAVDRFRLTELGMSAQPTKHSPRHVPRPTPLAVYLGVPEVSARRLAELNRIAKPFGGRSAMIQMIADGKLIVKSKDE